MSDVAEPERDERQDGREWFSPPLERLGAATAAVVIEQTGVYNAHQPPADWDVDVEHSSFRQGDVTVQMAPLGTFGTDGSWVWAWANERMHPPGALRLAASLRLRDLGRLRQIPELVTPRLELSEFPNPRFASERLCIAATGALEGRGYGSVTAKTGARFAMVMTDPAIPIADLDPVSMPRVIEQAIQVFPHDHRATVTGYLRRHRFRIVQRAPAVLVADHPRCSARMEFDDQGRLASMSLRMGGTGGNDGAGSSGAAGSGTAGESDGVGSAGQIG